MDPFVIFVLLIIVIVVASKKAKEKEKDQHASYKYTSTNYTSKPSSSSTSSAKSQRDYDKETKQLYKELDDAVKDSITYYETLKKTYAKDKPRLKSNVNKLLKELERSRRINHDIQEKDTNGRWIRNYLSSAEGRQVFQDARVHRQGTLDLKYGTSSSYVPPTSSSTYSYNDYSYEDSRRAEAQSQIDDLQREITRTKREVSRLRREGYVIDADELENGRLADLYNELAHM